METKKIAGVLFTETGVMVEKSYCDNCDEIKNQYRISADKLAEMLEVAKRVIKYRMADCYRKLHSNLANAKVITPQSIIWKGGHFEVAVWKQMEAILELDDICKLNRWQCQQLVRSLMFNSPNYWLSDHDENWNIVEKSDNVKLSDEFKMLITELFLCNDNTEI